jgi:hypothetical protein
MMPVSLAVAGCDHGPGSGVPQASRDQAPARSLLATGAALAGRSRSEADISLSCSLYEEEEGPTCKRETSPGGFLQN